MLGNLDNKLIFLNFNYIKNSTPQGYKDWLQLVKESIVNPVEPQLNLSNQGVKKASELIEYNQSHRIDFIRNL
jgi:hypothetical protein